MAALQVVVSGAVIFFLFRYLIKNIGAEGVGVWSIVLATASASRIGEMGFTASAVKFTAKYLSRGDKKLASEVIQTTAITVGVVLAILFVSGYSVIVWILRLIIPGEGINEAILILPYALLSMWIGALAGVFLSGLDGCQRINLRAVVSIISSIFFLLLVILLVPSKGLIGLAWAQIGQGLIMLLGGIIFLRKVLSSLPRIIFKWNYLLFKEMINYGINFQITSICSILFDPFTKALIAKFGDLSSVAYYEMANRMVLQFRMLVVSVAQVMVPKMAELFEIAPEKIQATYLYGYRVMFFVSIPLFFGVIAIAPLASEVWIGDFNQSFILYVVLLSIAYWINSLTVPAYFGFMGIGLMRWNTWAHILIAVLNIVFGYGLGYVLGGAGVIMGYLISLLFGSCVVIIAYNREYEIPLDSLIPIESIRLLFVATLGLVIGWILLYFVGEYFDILMGSWMLVGVFFITVIPVALMHPLGKLIKLN